MDGPLLAVRLKRPDRADNYHRLSGGTREQIATLVRIAYADLMATRGTHLPLVLDDPFAVLDDDELTSVLDRLVRLAGAVQVVLVTDREAAVAWAAQIGSEQALVHSA